MFIRHKYCIVIRLISCKIHNNNNHYLYYHKWQKININKDLKNEKLSNTIKFIIKDIHDVATRLKKYKIIKITDDINYRNHKNYKNINIMLNHISILTHNFN